MINILEQKPTNNLVDFCIGTPQDTYADKYKKNLVAGGIAFYVMIAPFGARPINELPKINPSVISIDSDKTIKNIECTIEKTEKNFSYTLCSINGPQSDLSIDIDEGEKIMKKHNSIKQVQSNVVESAKIVKSINGGFLENHDKISKNEFRSRDIQSSVEHGGKITRRIL